jgi:NAD(P)-dependent dehydrogenase (short-subunit alcohol dehydrogenase family)
MKTSPRVAIITGASRGIGRGIAERLADDGFACVVNFAHSQKAGLEVVERIDSRGGQSIAVQADIRLATERQHLVDAAYARWGRVDILVNNAGITSQGRRDVLEATEASWDAVFDTNLKGPFFLSQLVARRMIESPPPAGDPPRLIINISSISAYTVSTNRADYCIAKAGMRMTTWLLATRLAEHQIQVFEICPGVIASDMTEPVRDKYDRLIADGLTPIRRWGQPDDVARAVSALASGAFPFSTGDRINVDGGFHVRRM